MGSNHAPATTGKIVSSFNGRTSEFKINIPINLNSGLYFITINNNKNDKCVKKLVVSK